jgi:hypothetical protein
VKLESPSHGDLVSLGTAVQMTWRDSEVTDYQVVAEDVTTGAQRALSFGTLTPAQQSSRSFSMTLGDLFAGFPPAPVPGEQFRIVVTVYTSSSTADEVSSASIVVRFDQ